jgi:hypothetical protein
VYAYSRPGLRYVILTLLQTLYAYFVEGDIIFVGKRKTFDKRVRLSLFPWRAFLLTMTTDCHRADNP